MRTSATIRAATGPGVVPPLALPLGQAVEPEWAVRGHGYNGSGCAADQALQTGDIMLLGDVLPGGQAQRDPAEQVAYRETEGSFIGDDSAYRQDGQRGREQGVDEPAGLGCNGGVDGEEEAPVHRPLVGPGASTA